MAFVSGVLLALHWMRTPNWVRLLQDSSPFSGLCFADSPLKLGLWTDSGQSHVCHPLWAALAASALRLSLLEPLSTWRIDR